MGPLCAPEDAAGPILVTVLEMVAEMERRFIRERQQAGIEVAKAKGVSTGIANPLCRSRKCERCAMLSMAPLPSPRLLGSAG